MGYGWDEDSKPVETPKSGGADYESARRAYVETPKEKKPRSTTGSTPRSTPRSSTPVSEAPRKRRTAESGSTPPPVGLTIKSDSPTPWTVACDVTGSMHDWPDQIFEKLALFGNELKRYMPDYEISFCAFGDFQERDSDPLQVRPFRSGKPLDDELDLLYGEGAGGDDPESHGLVAYYYLNHCEIDKAVKPIFVLITDTDFHASVQESEVKSTTGDTIQGSLHAVDLMKRLAKKFNLYVVLAHGRARSFWVNLLDEQHVIDISEVRDLIEILIGIGAAEAGAMGDFEHRSATRHSDRPDRVSRVVESLSRVKAASAAASSDEAVGSKPDTDEKSGMRSKKLV